MKIMKIQCLASRFRHGIEIAHANRLFQKQPFLNFPNACCGDAPELLAQYLMDNFPRQNTSYKIVCGTYRYDDFENIFSHSWLVVDDVYILDITADQQQFKNDKIFPQDAVQRCYVGTNSEFHSMFEIEPSQCRRFCGLRKLDEYAYQRMKELYDVILDCIK